MGLSALILLMTRTHNFPSLLWNGNWAVHTHTPTQIGILFCPFYLAECETGFGTGLQLIWDKWMIWTKYFHSIHHRRFRLRNEYVSRLTMCVMEGIPAQYSQTMEITNPNGTLPLVVMDGNIEHAYQAIIGWAWCCWLCPQCVEHAYKATCRCCVQKAKFVSPSIDLFCSEVSVVKVENGFAWFKLLFCPFPVQSPYACIIRNNRSLNVVWIANGSRLSPLTSAYEMHANNWLPNGWRPHLERKCSLFHVQSIIVTHWYGINGVPALSLSVSRFLPFSSPSNW